MSLENIKCNFAKVTVSGAERVLDFGQVIFGVIGSSISSLCINVGTPNFLSIDGDFRDLIEGSGRQGMNSGPLFGAFTSVVDEGTPQPILVNFDQLNRFIDDTTLTFSHYGNIGSFTYRLLEDPIDVLGAAGHSVQDVGIFRVTKVDNAISPPVQSAASSAATGGDIEADEYFLVVTALTAAGQTTVSNEVSITTTGSTSTITSHWGLVTGATGYRVYIGTLTGAEGFYFAAGATATSLTITSIADGLIGTPPLVNTAYSPLLNTREIINIKNVTHQVPSGTNWTTTFIDGDVVIYMESIEDLVGG